MEKRIAFQRAGILLAYPMAYAYLRLLFYEWDYGWQNTVSFIAVALIFIVVSELVRLGRKPFARKNAGETLFWYIIMILTSATAFNGPSTLLSVFAMHLCAVYSVLVSNDLLLGGKTGGFIPADLIHGFYVKSFAGFPNFVYDWSAFKKEGERKRRNPAVVALIIGFIFLMVMFLCIAISFMSKIDADIADFLNSYFEGLIDYLRSIEIAEIFIRSLFAIPVCFYLYGLMSRSAKSDGVREKRIGGNISGALERGKKVPCAVSYICAGLFVVMYILFFAKRAAYFLGGFTGQVPEGQLVSHFARNGFFELVGIMAVNMCVYLTIYMFEKRNPEGRTSLPSRILVSALMAESIVFAVIAMSKLWLYFSIYGYTPKRMLAMWGTLVLGFAAMLSVLTIIRRKPHFRQGVYFSAVSYVAVSILSCVLAQLR